VPRPKSEKVKLSVFKGKEAKHNHAILCSLKQKSPQTAWELFSTLSKQKEMKGLTYWTVIRRMRALHKQDYVMAVGEIETMPGTETSLYQLTPRAEIALALDKINMDQFLKEAGYDRILIALEAFENWTP
jgi:hypothetical protein